MSSLPFEVMLALRYLRPKRTFVSIITLISIIGVTLGVAVLIIVISVMSGFDRQLRDKLLGLNAHLRIQSEDPIKDYQDILALVSKNPEVKAAAPYVIGQVLVKTQPDLGNPRILAPLIRGMDPAREDKVSILTRSLSEGVFDLKGNGIVLGRNLADRLRLRVGDHLAIYSIHELEQMADNRKEGREEAVLPDDFEVRGIFDVDYYDFNDLFVLCSLPNAQDLYAMGDAVHGLMIVLHDPERVDLVRPQLSNVLGPEFKLSTWKEENSSILSALLVEKNVMFYLLFFIMIVAAFGITSALITFVVQKTREIGVLKALGATRTQIMAVFLSQSLVVGVVGVLAGYGLGRLAVAYRNEFLLLMRRVTGFELFPASIYSFTELPALIVPRDLAIICGGSLIICLLAGLIPAWNAGRLKPVEALRHE